MQVIDNSNQELQANLIINHSSQANYNNNNNSNTLLYSQILVEMEANQAVEKVDFFFQMPITKAV